MGLQNVLGGLALEATQSAGNTVLSNLLAKLTSDPSTATLQGSGNTILSNILAKLIAAPATETTLASINSILGGVITVKGARKNDGTDLLAGNTHISVGGSDNVNLRVFLTDNVGRQVVNVNSMPNVGLNAGNKYIGQMGMLPGSQDVFGASVSTTRQPQINIQFFTDFISNLVKLTTSGGANAVSLPSAGYALMQSGTSTTASIIAVSPNAVVYQSGSEVWVEFTTTFTTPTSTNSYQRIGLYDGLNGFYLGYNGLSFGIGYRTNGVDTQVTQTSFNTDTLQAGASSLFTRNGFPESIDFTKLNVYRIRFGWLGIATAFYEVLDADGMWVIFHKVFLPNSFTVPSVATPNLPITLEISKTGADATNLAMNTACWSAGITGSMFPTTNALAPRNSLGVITTPSLQQYFRTTFAKTIASGIDSTFFNIIGTGTAQTISQSSGNLVLNAQTTVNADTIIRSNRSFVGSFVMRLQSLLSQRIVNNNFYVELVDIIGDGLVITVNSATSVTITFPNSFVVDATFVGQSMYIGNMTGFTGVTAISNRYTIASVSGQNVTFTVAGFVTGSVNTGTCSVFGWNYHQLLYTGTTATNASYDTQRRGWNSGFTVATINTTAAPGHMAIIGSEDGNAYFNDQLIASTATLPITQRATRVVNIAEENTPLYLQIRMVNGTVAPASNTVWTIGMIAIENYATQSVTLANAKVTSNNTAIPVTILSSNISFNLSQVGGTATVNGGLAGSLSVGGTVAHSGASNANPVQIGGRVVPTTPATTELTLLAGDVSYMPISSGLQVLQKPFSTAEVDVLTNFSTSASTTTLQVIVPASGTASVRTYLTGFTLQQDVLGAAGLALILDAQGAIGASVTIATPGVFTSTAHDLKVGQAIVFTSLGTITGVVTNTVYYVTATSFTTTTFTVATTIGGTAIAVTGSTSAFTFYRVLYQLKLQTPAIGAPAAVTFTNPIRTIGNGAVNFLIPTSLVNGNIYITPFGYNGF
jgi:hypothetical protein